MSEQTKTPRTDVCISELAMRPILYTDTVNGIQTCRDDMWAVTTEELNKLETVNGELLACCERALAVEKSVTQGQEMELRKGYLLMLETAVSKAKAAQP